MNRLSIHNKGVSKYLLLEDIETGEFFLVSDKTVSFHKEIYKRVTIKEGKSFICLGGGSMFVDENEIRCWGYSIDYGIPDSSIVESILKENTNKEIIIEIGIGYSLE